MAYDWSGNNKIQQRYDRIILAVASVIAISLATGTFVLRSQMEPDWHHKPSQTATAGPRKMAFAALIRTVRSTAA
ncbi:hypothetical protein [Agrobacterium tumefaciens]|uniref:hypothetical protein n=1 Tax=Agrobacterium tumefaciens TaxID=358 RepID=UPI002791F588|nr:hypothetical protein [Agrobacterium tumefaciens]